MSPNQLILLRLSGELEGRLHQRPRLQAGGLLQVPRRSAFLRRRLGHSPGLPHVRDALVSQQAGSGKSPGTDLLKVRSKLT